VLLHHITHVTVVASTPGRDRVGAWHSPHALRVTLRGEHSDRLAAADCARWPAESVDRFTDVELAPNDTPDASIVSR